MLSAEPARGGRHAIGQLAGVLGAGVLAAALLGLACRRAQGPEPGEIIGTWVTTRIEVVGKAGQGTLDLAQQGHQGTLVISADGTFGWHVRPVFAGGPCDLDGTWELETDLFRVSVSSGQVGWDISVAGGVMQLGNGDGAYDWDGDTVGDPSKVNLTLQHP